MSRREEILARAAELFAARGFHGVSVADLGAAVGISGPALYKHFPSKDAMLAEMLVRISEELPAAAGEGQSLTPLAVESGAEDPEGAATAMSEVLATVPSPLRGAITQVTASSASDVTLELALEDGGTKTVVWGDAHDAELKAEVVQALLGRPGDVIDVSSPVAPVTR